MHQKRGWPIGGPTICISYFSNMASIPPMLVGVEANRTDNSSKNASSRPAGWARRASSLTSADIAPGVRYQPRREDAAARRDADSIVANLEFVFTLQHIEPFILDLVNMKGGPRSGVLGSSSTAY